MKKALSPLIRAHFRQFVKPWPCATSHQEVGRGTPEGSACRRSIMMFSIIRTGGRRGAGHPLPSHQVAGTRGPPASPTSAHAAKEPCGTHRWTWPPRDQGCCLPTQIPPLRTGVFRPRAAQRPGLSHLGGTLLPGDGPSPAPRPSHSTGAERKVEPFAKYAKKEGR